MESFIRRRRRLSSSSSSVFVFFVFVFVATFVIVVYFKRETEGAAATLGPFAFVLTKPHDS